MNIRQTESSQKSRLHLPLHVILAYLLVCSLLLTGVSFSRYISSEGGSDNARVAAGAVVVSYDDDTIVEMMRPEDDGTLTEDFHFSVSNTVSEVAIQYDLVVKLDNPLPDGVSMALDGTSCTDSGDHTYTFANMGTFAAGVEATHTHTLSFTGDFGIYQTPGEVEYPVTISVLAEQID